MVANATAAMKPSNRLPPTALARWMAGHVAAAQQAFRDVAADMTRSGWVRTIMIAPKPMMKVRM